MPDVSIRLSVEDADSATAAMDKFGADGEAALQRLAAASAAAQSSLNGLDGKISSLKAANDNASNGWVDGANKAKEFSGSIAETAENILNTINHLKLLALAAYALSPAFRSVVSSGVAVAFGQIPTVAGLAGQAIGRLSPMLGPLLSFFSRITVPIGGAVLAFEAFNYVAKQGSDILEKYKGYERGLFADDVDDNLKKLTKLQPDEAPLNAGQIQNAIELAARLDEAKRNIDQFLKVQIDVSDAALRLQTIWVGIVGLIGDAAAKLNSFSATANPEILKIFSYFSKIVGLGADVVAGAPVALGVGVHGLLSGDQAQPDAMRLAHSRLAVNMDVAAYNKLSDDEKSKYQFKTFSGLFGAQINALAADPPKEKQATGPDAYDRFKDSIGTQIQQLQQQAEGATKTSAAVEELKVAHEGYVAATKAGIPVTDQMRAQWKSWGDQIAAVNIQIKQTKALQSEQFKTDTMFMTPSEQAAANVAKSIDPNDWQSHLHDAAAQQAAFNSQLSQARDIADQFAVSFTSGLTRGETAAKALRQSVLSLVQTIEQAAVKGLVNKIFAGLFGGAGGGGGGAAGGTSSSGFTGALSGLFADGGVMTPYGPMALHHYASGGVATGPQLALFGEGRDHEAYVPLPDGRAIPVRLTGGAGGQPTQVNNQYHVHISGARGSQEITDAVHAGMAQAVGHSAALLKSYDKALPGRMADVRNRYG